jgi:N-acyl-D-amino-acid deacylase
MSARTMQGLLLAGGVVLLLSLPASCQTTDSENKTPSVPISGKADPKFAKVDELMTLMLTKFKLPGAVLAVAQNGKLVYSRGFGHADVENKQVMKADALFRISSISKPITAAAIMQLVEKGKLKLDDKIMNVLALGQPSGKFDQRWKKITIRHLLEHRGGWDSNKSRDPVFWSPLIVRTMSGSRHPASAPLITAYMLRQPLDFEPGEKFVYCNFGYLLLGRVIERLTKQNYETYIKTHVLKPLDITHMRLGKSLLASRAPGEVRYYSDKKSTAVLGPQVGQQVPAAYGGFPLETMAAPLGWLASASDLIRLACAFEDPKKCKILEPATAESLFVPPVGEEKKEVYYAKGWIVRPFGEGKRSYWHDGSLEGVSALLVRRADGISFAVLFNSNAKAGDNDPAGTIEIPLHVHLNAVFWGK